MSFLYSSDGFYGGVDYRAFEQSVDLELNSFPVQNQIHILEEEGEDIKTESEEDVDEKYIVDWNGPADPENPMNWSNMRKWTAVLIVSSITFVTFVVLPLT